MIIGSGPAGLSAAIYSSRAGLKPVVVAPAMGGQLQGKGVGVENFPGVNESTGPNLVHLMQLQVRVKSFRAQFVVCTYLPHLIAVQAARFGAVFEQDMVVEVDIRARPFTVKTNETTIRAHRHAGSTSFFSAANF